MTVQHIQELKAKWDREIQRYNEFFDSVASSWTELLPVLRLTDTSFPCGKRDGLIHVGRSLEQRDHTQLLFTPDILLDGEEDLSDKSYPLLEMDLRTKAIAMPLLPDLCDKAISHLTMLSSEGQALAQFEALMSGHKDFGSKMQDILAYVMSGTSDHSRATHRDNGGDIILGTHRIQVKHSKGNQTKRRHRTFDFSRIYGVGAANTFNSIVLVGFDTVDREIYYFHIPERKLSQLVLTAKERERNQFAYYYLPTPRSRQWTKDRYNWMQQFRTTLDDLAILHEKEENLDTRLQVAYLFEKKIWNYIDQK